GPVDEAHVVFDAKASPEAGASGGTTAKRVLLYRKPAKYLDAELTFDGDPSPKAIKLAVSNECKAKYDAEDKGYLKSVTLAWEYNTDLFRMFRIDSYTGDLNQALATWADAVNKSDGYLTSLLVPSNVVWRVLWRRPSEAGRTHSPLQQ